MLDLFFDNKFPQVYHILRFGDIYAQDTENTDKYSVSYRLMFVSSGEIAVNTDGADYLLQKGDLLLLLPETGYSTVFKSGKVEICNIFFGFEAKPGCFPSPGLFKADKAVCKKYSFTKAAAFNGIKHIKAFNFFNLFDELYKIYTQSFYTAGLNLQMLFYELLLKINSRVSMQKAASTSAAIEIKKYIDDNIFFEDKLLRKKIASIFGYHPNYLNRLFKDYFDCSIKNYLLKSKISHSIPLIVETDCTVTDIALQLGFFDTSHFCSTFKKITGYTPGDFRSFNNRRD